MPEMANNKGAGFYGYRLIVAASREGANIEDDCAPENVGSVRCVCETESGEGPRDRCLRWRTTRVRGSMDIG